MECEGDCDGNAVERAKAEGGIESSESNGREAEVFDGP